MEPLFELGLKGVADGAGRSAANLHRQLRDAILQGRLAPGSRLPPTRQAQARFGVSRSTATEAYERLLHDGLVVSRHGSGTFVAAVPPQLRAAPPSPVAEGPDPRLNPFWTSDAAARAIGYWAGGDDLSEAAAIDLRPAVIDPRPFPFDRLRQSFTRELRRMERRPARNHSPQGNQGSFHLRSAIADHVALTRAVACRPDEVLVTSGAQQAFDLVARVMVRPSQTVVAVEEPGYPPLRAPFAAAGASILPIPTDDEGLRVDLIPAGVHVVCTTPSHQFPLGVPLSPRRRTDLLAFARAAGAVVVEDDYDGEFRYEGSPLTALRTADAADVVFYVGTFSKTMLPSLRLGFVIPPPWALEALVAAKNASDWHASSILQRGVAAFMAEGRLARHVSRMRQVYAGRRRTVLAAMEEQLPADMRVLPSYGGMHVTVVSDRARDLDAAARQISAEGVRVHGLGRYFAAEPAFSGLVIGFGAADEAQLPRAVTLISEVLHRS